MLCVSACAAAAAAAAAAAMAAAVVARAPISITFFRFFLSFFWVSSNHSYLLSERGVEGVWPPSGCEWQRWSWTFHSKPAPPPHR